MQFDKAFPICKSTWFAVGFVEYSTSTSGGLSNSGLETVVCENTNTRRKLYK